MDTAPLPDPLPDMMEVAGIQCHVHETSALEAWFMMNGFRQVICADEPPAQRGTLVVVASEPLAAKEENFILEMSATGGCPPLNAFLEISGIVGVVDFHVESTTDLPGWDGESIPVVLSNPRWFRDGKLIPVPPPIIMDEEFEIDDQSHTDRPSHGNRPSRSDRPSRRNRRHRR